MAAKRLLEQGQFINAIKQDCRALAIGFDVHQKKARIKYCTFCEDHA